MKTIDILTRYRVFHVKYHGPGNVRGSRITIHDLRHSKRKALNYRHDGGDACDQAIDYLAGIGITISALGLADALPGHLLLCDECATPLR